MPGMCTGVLAFAIGSAFGGYTDARAQWVLNLTHLGAGIPTLWPALSVAETQALASKAAGWLNHSAQQGDAGHIQWGQAMPQVQGRMLCEASSPASLHLLFPPSYHLFLSPR